MTAFLKEIHRVPNIHHKLKKIYGRILHLMRKLPKDVEYRKNTEAIICHRLSIVEAAENDIRMIEKNICGGNIYMILRQAEDEYALLQKILIWKPWEPLMTEPPPKQWTWPPC